MEAPSSSSDIRLVSPDWLQSDEFQLRRVRRKAIQLRESGKGKRKNKADPVMAEEELLWESCALGCNNPESLNHSVWYTLSQHFGTRGVQVSEGRMSPRTSCIRAQCPPGHSALAQIVPLSAECPPTLVLLDRVHKGAVERTG